MILQKNLLIYLCHLINLMKLFHLIVTKHSDIFDQAIIDSLLDYNDIENIILGWWIYKIKVS